MSDPIGEITKIRTSNNKLWMAILELALQYAPPEHTKPLLRLIIANDKQVTSILESLVQE